VKDDRDVGERVRGHGLLLEDGRALESPVPLLYRGAAPYCQGFAAGVRFAAEPDPP
jgi:hypothetical protein